MKPGAYGLPPRSSVIVRRRRRRRIVAGTTAASLFGFVAWVTYAAWPHRAEVITQMSAAITTPEPAGDVPVAAPLGARPVYGHSIVPGGAYSSAEVADAIQKDAVVAAHYEDIDVEKLRAKRVDVSRAVYVSYRIGEQVYWTKNRVHLAAGETVLTDGEDEIRARCGNLLSDTAREPVAPAGDPLVALDVPEPAPDTGSSTMAGSRDPDDALTHVPSLPGSYAGGTGPQLVPGMAAGITPPFWMGGGSGGTSRVSGSSPGTNGTSLAAPHGSTPRTIVGGGPIGGGPSGGGPGGGSTGDGGSTGHGGDPDDGPKGGGEDTPAFVPPTITTGSPGTDTTGGDHTTGGFETTGGFDTTGDGETTGDDEIHTVPEPGTLVLLALGACGLASRAVRARQRRG